MNNSEKVRWGIVKKLMLVFIVMITFSLGISGYSSYDKSKELIKETQNNFSVQMLREMEDTIDIYTEGLELQLLKLSTQASVKTLLTQADATSGATKVETPEGAKNEEAVTWVMKDFVSLIETNKDIKQVHLVTGDKETFSYPYIDSGEDPTKEPWYKETASAKEIEWTQPYMHKDAKEMYVTAAMSIIDDDKTFLGVLSMDISLNSLSEKINEKIIGERGYPIVLDNSGNLVIHRDSNLIGKPLPSQEIMTAIKEGEEGQVNYLWKEDETVYDKRAVFSKLDKLQWRIMTTMYMDEIYKATGVLLRNAILVGASAILVTMLILYIFSIKISRHMKQLFTNMEAIKKGDLTAKSDFKSADELGKLSETFNNTLDTVARLISNVQRVSAETAASAQGLGATAQESTASIQEVTSAISEIAAGAADQAKESENGVELTLHMSQKFNQLRQNTENMSQSAGKVVDTMEDGMDAVNDLRDKTKLNGEATGNIERAISSLSIKIQNIDSFLKTISDISEQTNLLALNAAIEAARAGEHGRGFAVVAEEIRNLAAGSTEAAEEIKGIIDDIQRDSNHSVETMKEVKLRSEDQTEAVFLVDKAFESILKALKSITDKIESTKKFVEEINQDKEAIVVSIEGISTIAEETSASSEQVTATMQQQASVMEEIARAAEKLSDLAINLNSEIDKFKVK